MKLGEKRVHRPRADDLRGVKADIFRVTGLRADFDRLSDQEAVELRALTLDARREAATADVEGCDPARLDAGSRGRWEKLTEAAASEPGWFARQRRAAKLERDRAAKARKPSKQVRFEQPGVIVLPAAIL